jgi:hypothetical protein
VTLVRRAGAKFTLRNRNHHNPLDLTDLVTSSSDCFLLPGYRGRCGMSGLDYNLFCSARGGSWPRLGPAGCQPERPLSVVNQPRPRMTGRAESDPIRTSPISASSFALYVGGLYDRPPFVDFSLLISAERLRGLLVVRGNLLREIG